MADDTAVKPKEHNGFRKAITSFLTDAVLFGLAKQLVSSISDFFIKQPAEKALQIGEEHKSGDKHTFGEALTKLQNDKPELAKIIDQFMSGGPDGLQNLDERNDFIINAAKTGKDVPGTYEFLLKLASLPDHAARRRRLTNISYIGEGEQSFLEAHAGTIANVKRWLRDQIHRSQRRNRASDRDRFTSAYRRLRKERKHGATRRFLDRALDILFAR